MRGSGSPTSECHDEAVAGSLEVPATASCCWCCLGQSAAPQCGQNFCPGWCFCPQFGQNRSPLSGPASAAVAPAVAGAVGALGRGAATWGAAGATTGAADCTTGWGAGGG